MSQVKTWEAGKHLESALSTTGKIYSRYEIIWGLIIELFQCRNDVTELDQLTETFERIKRDLGRIDNWYGSNFRMREKEIKTKQQYPSITAAGLVLDKPFHDHEWEECSKILNVNVSIPS